MYTQLNSSDELRCIYLGYFIYPIKGPDVTVTTNLNLVPLSKKKVLNSQHMRTRTRKGERPAGVLSELLSS